MDLLNYRHVIWDWNGTLFDDAWLCIDVMNGLLRKRGLPLLTEDRYCELFGFPVVDYYRRLGFDFSKESFETLGTAFIVEYEKRRLECSLQPGAIEALRAIRQAGLTQSMLSAYKQATLHELVRHFGIEEFFVRLIGLDDHYAGGKLDRARQWARELDCGPHELVLIGDTLHDHEVACAIGADCLLIAGGHHSVEKLAACGAILAASLEEAAARLTGPGRPVR